MLGGRFFCAAQKIAEPRLRRIHAQQGLTREYAGFMRGGIGCARFFGNAGCAAITINALNYFPRMPARRGGGTIRMAASGKMGPA